MKKVLVIRYPLSFPASDAELSYVKTKERVGDDFIVLPFHSNVEKVEVEIVFDPNQKAGGQNA